MKNRTLKILTVVLALALVATIAYSTIVIYRKLTGNFTLKVAYGMQIYSDPNCTTVMSGLNFEFASKDELIYIQGYIRNEGNDGMQLSWNSTFPSWNNTIQAYKNANYDFSLAYYEGGPIGFHSEHSDSPTVLNMTKDQVLHVQFASKCLTDSPDNNILGVDIFINGLSV